MSSIEAVLKKMEKNSSVSFRDLCKVCKHYFGEPRQSGSSHKVYKTPWEGDPRINIQSDKGQSKRYQVKQVLKAIEKKIAMDEQEEEK